MKKEILKLSIVYYVLTTNIYTYAAETGKWLLWGAVSTEQIKEWDFHIDDIPNIIQYLITAFLWIAWTVSVLFVIIWAYKLLFGSLKSDHTKWRETIIMAISGFAISALAWFIVKFIFTILSQPSIVIKVSLITALVVYVLPNGEK